MTHELGAYSIPTSVLAKIVTDDAAETLTDASLLICKENIRLQYC